MLPVGHATVNARAWSRGDGLSFEFDVLVRLGLNEPRQSCNSMLTWRKM